MRSLLLTLALVQFGCDGDIGDHLLGDPGGGGETGGGPGGGGVDTGGAQDIKAAREIINNGGVPDPSWITVEGLLSEHDVPTSGAPCHDPICVRPATGIAPSLETGKLERWVHVGMTTGIDLSTWVRPPIDLVIAIDKSSSMSGDLIETTEAAARLVGHMREGDRVSVLAFNGSIQVLQELGPVTDLAMLQAKVRGLIPGGEWNITAALDAAYGRLTSADPARIRRVVIMSCGYPSVSPTGDDPIGGKIRTQGAAGIGITFVGVLLGWSADLAKLLGQTNGANYYYTSSLTDVEEVFDRDADFIVTPVAYDLALALQLSQNWSLSRMYGIPGDADGNPAPGYNIATAFFSRRRGSVVARLEYTGTGNPPPAAAAVSLSYRPESALGWTDPFTEVVDAMTGSPEPDGTYYGTAGVHKAVMLVNMAVRMIAGCTTWQTDQAGARTIIAELRDYLVAEQAVLADPAIDAEVALVNKLYANMGGT